MPISCINDAGEEHLQSWNGIDYQMIHDDNMQDFEPPYAEEWRSYREVGALRLGKALWVLMARIAGWTEFRDVKHDPKRDGIIVEIDGIRYLWDSEEMVIQ